MHELQRRTRYIAKVVGKDIYLRRGGGYVSKNIALWDTIGAVKRQISAYNNYALNYTWNNQPFYEFEIIPVDEVLQTDLKPTTIYVGNQGYPKPKTDDAS